jgi:hypothetical protein
MPHGRHGGHHNGSNLNIVKALQQLATDSLPGSKHTVQWLGTQP